MVNLRLDRLGSRRTVYVQTTPGRSEVHLKKKRKFGGIFLGHHHRRRCRRCRDHEGPNVGSVDTNCDDANDSLK